MHCTVCVFNVHKFALNGFLLFKKWNQTVCFLQTVQTTLTEPNVDISSSNENF